MATVTRTKGPGYAQLQALNTGLATNKQGKVGWFESARYPNGTPVAYVATIQEYGYPPKKIPPRSFMRTTIIEQQDKWRVTVQQGAKIILDGHGNAGTVLDLVGQQAAGDIAKKIASIESPPLKPATIAARLRRRADKKTIGNLDKPLVDTGLMISTITNIVEDAQ